MSLYNLIHGYDPFAPFVLCLLGVPTEEFGRFRDAGFDNGRMYVLARVGTGNWGGEYQELFEKIRTHPLYAGDEDDEFDPTFRYFYFRFPSRDEPLGARFANLHPVELERLFENIEDARKRGPKVSLREKTERAVEALAKGGVPNG